MNQNRAMLMERINRSYVEHIRQIEDGGGGVHRASLTEVYLYLKGRELRESEVDALLRFRDPLMIALTCWKERRGRTRFLFHLHPLAAKVNNPVVMSRIVRLLLPFRYGTPRRHRGTLIDEQQIPSPLAQAAEAAA